MPRSPSVSPLRWQGPTQCLPAPSDVRGQSRALHRGLSHTVTPWSPRVEVTQRSGGPGAQSLPSFTTTCWSPA